LTFLIKVYLPDIVIGQGEKIITVTPQRMRVQIAPPPFGLGRRRCEQRE
jgi:hypothetical protein